jgi:predicted nucleic acid-binding protein
MSLFVDTSAWLALEDRSDQYHKEAVRIAEQLKKRRIPWMTTEYIYLETVTLIRYRVSHGAAVVFGERLRASQLVEIIEIDHQLRDLSWEIFKRYSDKEFSLVDCSSFALMQKKEIQEVFSFDHHFTQMGFRRVGPSD